MRLIDADAFKITHDRYDGDAPNGGLYLDGVEDVLLSIDDAPTITPEPRWISVKDRLPESGEHVLVCCEVRPSKKKYVCDGFYASKHSLSVHYVDDDNAYEYDEEADEYFLLEGWYEIIKNWEEYNSIVIADFVTYWMPLPEMPKEENE